MYDYLIVGSGPYGATFAYEMHKRNKKVLIIEKRKHIGGNCYTQNIEGINVHVYGNHIFNTNNKRIWDYVNQFCEFEQYTHRVKVNYQGKIFSFPINLMTLHQLWGCTTPQEAAQILQSKQSSIAHPNNLKEWVESQLGEEIFNIFYKGYSEKQWGKRCTEIPCNISKRIPIRMTYDDRYHETLYTGMPKGGNYTELFERMLDGIEVRLNVDFNDLKNVWRHIAKKLVYTGSLDEFFDFQFGPLDYRSLSFDTKVLDIANYQGIAQMNYTSSDVPYTRIIEHKWLTTCQSSKTVISYEYPQAWELGKERYYPVVDEYAKKLYQRYKNNIDPTLIIVGGRLGKFQYFDMDQVFASALNDVEKELSHG